MEREIRITAEPVDAARCRFVLEEPVYEGVRRFKSAEEAAGSPLAAGIFAIPDLGVREVVVSGGTITVTKDSGTPWQAVGRAVGQAIRSAVAGPVPAVAAPPVAPAGSGADDALYDRVADLFDNQINPMVARHGGRIELIDVQDAVVMLRMSGGCQGCGMADVTLRQGVEAMLAREVPEIQGIVDITDHSAGAAPYVSASKK